MVLFVTQLVLSIYLQFVAILTGEVVHQDIIYTLGPRLSPGAKYPSPGRQVFLNATRP